jgi:hypothetical protein
MVEQLLSLQIQLDGSLIYSKTVDIKQFGAKTDGTDCSAAVNAALAVASIYTSDAGPYTCNSTITVPSARSVDLGYATWIANTGATPLFKSAIAGALIHFRQAGGIISGTCSAAIQLMGATDQPGPITDKAHIIWIEGLCVSSPTITYAVDLQKSVHQIFIDSCSFFTLNGINANGKCIEVYTGASSIFGATGGAGTVGVKLLSTGGGAFYNEGFTFVNCTVDGFEKAFDVTDIFVLTVVGGYVAAPAGKYAFDFHAPTTNLNEEVIVGGGVVIGAKVRWNASAGGIAYNSKFDNFTVINVTGDAFEVGNNAASITISNGKFKTGGNTAVGVHTSGVNANKIIAKNLDFDGTYDRGAYFQHTVGTGSLIEGLVGSVITGMVFAFQNTTRISNNTIDKAAEIPFTYIYNANDLAGNKIVGADIASQVISCTKGEQGWIDFGLPCSGMNAATQRFDITVPAGMTIPSGVGWGSQFVYPGAAGAWVSDKIPYVCTADINAGTLKITNAVGNTVTLNSHGRFGIVRK